MGPLPFRFVLTIFSLYSLHSVLSMGLTKSHRGVNHGTQLGYAQSPIDFLNSKGYDPGRSNDKNSIANRHTDSSESNRQQKPSTNSFSGALPYNEYVAHGHNAGNTLGTQPIATQYRNHQNDQPNNYGGKFSSSSNAYNDAIATSAVAYPNRHSAQSHQSSPLTPKPQPSSATNYFPQNSNVQKKLNFNLFNSNDFGRSAPDFGRGSGSFGRGASNFGRDNSDFTRDSTSLGRGSAYAQSNPFSSHVQRNLFQPQQQQKFPYDIAANSHEQIGNGYNNNYNNEYGYNGFSPVLSQGFSVPTTYQGERKAEILPNEAFSSVTDPRSDKRVAISSYVPANNFVNPSNFLIPTEDKYNMISRIFGGFKVPVQQKQQQQKTKPNKPSSPHLTKSPLTGPYDAFDAYKNNQKNNINNNKNNNKDNYNTKGFDSKNQNLLSNNYNNNNFNTNNYGKQNSGGPTGDQMIAASTQVKNQGPYFSGSKSLAKPGYGQRFEDQGAFSYSPGNPSAQGYNKGSVFGARDDPPTLLFSDFTNNNPLSLNQFRSKNLLGDADFGKTEYDNNRLTPDSLFQRNNQNYYQNGDFFAPGASSQVVGKVSETSGYKQIGGAAGNSYDKSYSNNRGYDKSFDDNAQVKNYSPHNGGYSDQSGQTDGYKNAATYSDGDGYSKSFQYSDGGGDSDYKSTDDHNEKGYETSYQNSDDDSDMDSYNDSQGYNRVYYGGKNFDETDGYTDKINYDTTNKQDSNQEHYSTDSNNDDGVTNYKQGVDKITSVLSATGTPTIQPYRGLTKPVTDDLPTQASYKPFSVN